jgi:F0F1-type ATP synthase assembly protein I
MLQAFPVGTVGGRSDRRHDHPTPFLRRAGIYLGIAFELPATIIGGLFLGYLADEYFGSSPWLLIGLTLVAFVGAFVRLVHWVRILSRRNDAATGK